MVTAIAKGSPRERGSILGVVGGRGLILGIIAWLILSMPGPNPVARAQVGGAFPSFLWGARLKASFLEGVPAEDPFAALGNPAAGRGCDTEAVAMEQARPFGVPITAAAWCHGPWQGHLLVRQTPAGLGFDYNAYTLAAGRVWQHRGEGVVWNVGVVPKLLLLSIAGTTTDHDDRATGYSIDGGFGVDVDIDVGPFRTLSFGGALLNGVSRLQYDGGPAEAAAAPSFLWSMNVAGPRLLVGVTGRADDPDTPPRWRVGAEYVFPDDGVALRAGVGEDGEAAVGLGVTLGGFAVDYAYRWQREDSVGDTVHALSTRFPLSSRARVPVSLDEIRLTQKLTVGFGTLSGDGSAFVDRENRPVPSLNPDIRVEGRVGLRTRIGDEGYARLETGWAGQGETTFGVGWRAWEVAYGPHTVQFIPAGLPYTTTSTGLGVTYDGPDRFLHVVTARRQARNGQARIVGDDSFGPFFLGYKNIVAESERIFIDDRLLTRGHGPGDGDYYVDYGGGFLYFNQVVLAHETVQAYFQYEADDPAQVGNFTAALATLKSDRSTVGAFVLRDHAPLDGDGIGIRPGSTFLAYGGEVTSLPAPGLRLTNGVVFTDVRELFPTTLSTRESFALDAAQNEYVLQNKPVLYESERIVLHGPGGDERLLLRHLDYTVDYVEGRIEFAIVPGEGERVEVRYEYVARDSPGRERVRQGGETRHRIDYEGERWRSTTWFDAVEGEYVPVIGAAEPSHQLAAATTNEYVLRSNWTLIGDGTIRRQHGEQTWTTAVGLGYETVRLRSRLRIGRERTTTGRGTTEKDYVEGDFLSLGPGQLALRFRQPLDSYRGGLPEQMEAGVRGQIGLSSYAVTYTHGDEHYDDKVEATVTVPVGGEHSRGGVTLATRWLYPAGFGDIPRTVHSVIGDVTYNPSDSLYARTQVTGVVSRSALATTNSYNVRGSAGRSLGLGGVLDYEFNWSGRQTEGMTSSPGLGDEQTSISHTFTLAGTLGSNIDGAPSSGLDGALLWRQTDGRRHRSDRAVTESRERGWQVSLSGHFGPFKTTLSYNTSVMRTDVGSHRTVSDGQSTAVTLRWDGIAGSVRVGWEQSFRDGTDRRRTIRVEPVYRLSSAAELSFTYEGIRVEDTYDAHIFQIGFSVQY